MSFKYDYIPLDQLESEKPEVILLADGPAKFTIDNVYDKDKAGNPLVTREGTPKISLKLICTDSRGRQGIIYHHISSKMQWAIIDLGKALNKKLYNESGRADWFSIRGMSGRCELENRPPQPPYEARTSLKKYLPAPERPEVSSYRQEKVEYLDDDLPF